MSPVLLQAAYVAAALLFIAVFPANVNMIREWVDKSPALKTIAWARLPLQIPLIVRAVKIARNA